MLDDKSPKKESPLSFEELKNKSPLPFRDPKKESPLPFEDSKKESPLHFEDNKKESPLPAGERVRVRGIKSNFRLFKREFRLCYRHRMSLLNALLFVVVVASIFPLATTPDPKILQLIGPGVIWISALLGMLLSIQSLFKDDYQDGSLDHMLMIPSALSYYVFSKVFSHWILLTLPLIMITPVLAVLYHLNMHTIERLMLGLLLGTPSLSFIGAIIAALTLTLRNSGLLLLLMALPFYVPIVIFGTTAALSIHPGLPLAQFAFLAALFAIVITCLPTAIAAVLRMNVSYE